MSLDALKHDATLRRGKWISARPLPACRATSVSASTCAGLDRKGFARRKIYVKANWLTLTSIWQKIYVRIYRKILESIEIYVEFIF
jgi:hypothetical protein